MVDIRKFHSKLLKIDKKPYKDFDIYYIVYSLYYICYITNKKFSGYKNIRSVNPLYLMIYSAVGYFEEKNGKKYLIIDSAEKYEKYFPGIRSEIKTINGRKELFYEKN